MVELSNTVSKDGLLQRNKQIYDEVLAGRFELQWCKLVLNDKAGNTLEVAVTCDALRMPVRTVTREGQTVQDPQTRITVDAYTQQEIADHLGALLLTPKLVDEIYRASTKLTPSTRTPGTQMASAAEMIRHSQDVDKKILVKDGGPLFSNVGKDWVIDKKIFEPSKVAVNASANYGWLGTGSDRSVTGLPIIQSVGTTHNAGTGPSSQFPNGEVGHSDYSQTSRFVHRAATYNGTPVDLAEIYVGKGPSAATALVSHDGALPSARIPQDTGSPPILEEPPDFFVEPPPPPAEVPPGETPAGPAPKRGGAAGTAVAGAALGAGTGYVAAGTGGGIFGAIAGAILGLLGRRKKK